jgi:hypothetical protein
MSHHAGGSSRLLIALALVALMAAFLAVLIVVLLARSVLGG